MFTNLFDTIKQNSIIIRRMTINIMTIFISIVANRIGLTIYLICNIKLQGKINCNLRETRILQFEPRSIFNYCSEHQKSHSIISTDI